MKKKQKNSPAPADTRPAIGLEAPDGWRLGIWIWLAIAALVATFFAYISIVNAPFVFDDLSGVFLYPNAADIPFSKWIGITRPLTTFTFWLNYKLGGTDPSSYHWLNLFLHFASGVFVTVIVRRLL